MITECAKVRSNSKKENDNLGSWWDSQGRFQVDATPQQDVACGTEMRVEGKRVRSHGERQRSPAEEGRLVWAGEWRTGWEEMRLEKQAGPE